MKNNQAETLFREAAIPTAVLQNAVLAMLAMLMVLIYNLADTFFIGQTHDALQVAAVSLATPVFLMFMSVGSIFGIGGTSVISRAIGEGRQEYAKKVCSFCMWGCVVTGLLLSAFFLIFMDNILTWIGASPDTWQFAKTYLMIVSFCGPFATISNCYSNVIRAEGQSGKAMMGQVLGNLLNIALDPILILALGWDIAGAAVATVIGNVVATCYYVYYFLWGNYSLSIGLKDFTYKEEVLWNVFAIGIPASLGSLLMSVSQIVMNGLMADYGDMALAGIGVAMKVTMMTGMICIGFGQGVQPLLGYCVGARLWERFQKVMRFSLLFSLGLSVVMTGLCYLFTKQIVQAFLNELEAFQYAVQFVYILLTTSCLFGIFYVLGNALQAMGAATEALIINLSRQGFIYIPALFIMNVAVGVTGLIWAQPVADLLSTVIVVALYLKTFQKMRKKAEHAGLAS